MPDGTRRPITAVRDGDLVLTKDGAHRAGAVTPSGVRRVGSVTLTNGLRVRGTPEHPIFTHRGWVNAERLAPDDRVAVLDAVAAAFERVAARRSGGARAAGLAATPMLWAAPVSFVPEGTEPTYDIEVPGAHSFIANGIAVHNSHAGAYALVAYQTAYFKANYPVEFMAALLTSEMGDTDKIVKYIEECRAMGLTVSPPDVNVSAVQFSVASDTIRFGLAAIKNVGEAAMESILATRAAEGAFKTLDDFCARVDLRLVNRRVIESLVKAGAFDSLGLTPSGDLATRSHGARVTLLGHVAALKETATKSGNRMAFVTLEDMAGTVEVTVFPEPFKAAAPFLRSREPLVVRGRVDDGDKGRVILAEDVRLLEQALGGAARPRAAGGEAGACPIRVAANGDPERRLSALRRICEAHPGGPSVFVHAALTGQEVVIRARGCSVDAAPELVSEVEALLGPAAMTIDYA